MKRILAFLMFAVSHFVYAQTDLVYLGNPTKSISVFSEYEILFPQKTFFVRETYSMFKGRYWLNKTDTLQFEKFQIEGNQYIGQSKRKPIVYKSYGACDSLVNKIRNSHLYWQLYNKMDREVRSKIGLDNEAFRNFRSISWLSQDKILGGNCSADFPKFVDSLYKSQSIFLDSIYQEKISRLELVRSNPEVIDSLFVDEFIRTFNENDTDLSSFAFIANQQPELLMASLQKQKFSAYYKLDGFPKVVDLRKTKTILKKSSVRSPETRRLLKNMKYKKEY